MRRNDTSIHGRWKIVLSTFGRLLLWEHLKIWMLHGNKELLYCVLRIMGFPHSVCESFQVHWFLPSWSGQPVACGTQPATSFHWLFASDQLLHLGWKTAIVPLKNIQVAQYYQELRQTSPCKHYWGAMFLNINDASKAIRLWRQL